MNTLFSKVKVGHIVLQNRIIMGPMTRCRAVGNVANASIKTYYEQRASAGLIVTECVAVSPDSLGYTRMPAMYTDEQEASWKPVAKAVHDKNGHIFMQLVHTGRIAHLSNMPAGAKVVAPSDGKAKGQIWSDVESMVDHSEAQALTVEEIKIIIDDYVAAAKRAIAAGLDGVEIHAASGYLPNQFLSTNANSRTDEYGGSIANRARFVLEIVRAVTQAIGSDKVGIKISPGMSFNDCEVSDAEFIYPYLAQELNEFGLAYLNVFRLPGYGTFDVVPTFRKVYKGTLFFGCAFDYASGEALVEQGMADGIVFGTAFIGNPDLPERFKTGANLVIADRTTFYTPGDKGYIDYAPLETATV